MGGLPLAEAGAFWGLSREQDSRLESWSQAARLPPTESAQGSRAERPVLPGQPRPTLLGAIALSGPQTDPGHDIGRSLDTTLGDL